MTDNDSKHLGCEFSGSSLSLVEAICQRHSVRGFLNRPVSQELMEKIFQISQSAPSNCNVQPWRVYVASGALKNRLSDEMVKLVSAEVKPNPDFEYPGKFEGEYRRRQIECAIALYSKMNISRDDEPGRRRALVRNYEFFDAPHMAFIGMDPKFGASVAIDVGMWAQTFMLTLVAFGLHSCAMGTMRNYPDLIRNAFNITDNTKILFGIAFGYEDLEVAANATRTTRDSISANTVFKSN